MNKEEALQASDTALQELATALRQGKSDSLLHDLCRSRIWRSWNTAAGALTCSGAGVAHRRRASVGTAR